MNDERTFIYVDERVDETIIFSVIDE